MSKCGHAAMKAGLRCRTQVKKSHFAVCTCEVYYNANKLDCFRHMTLT